MDMGDEQPQPFHQKQTSKEIMCIFVPFIENELNKMKSELLAFVRKEIKSELTLVRQELNIAKKAVYQSMLQTAGNRNKSIASNLPHEIWINILEYASPLTLDALTLVNGELNGVVKVVVDNMIKLGTAKITPYMCNEDLSQIITDNPIFAHYVKELKFPECPYLTDISLLERCDNLRKINLENANFQKIFRIRDNLPYIEIQYPRYIERHSKEQQIECVTLCIQQTLNGNARIYANVPRDAYAKDVADALMQERNRKSNFYYQGNEITTLELPFREFYTVHELLRVFDYRVPLQILR